LREYVVHSEEFEDKKMNGFNNIDAAKEWIRWSISKIILRTGETPTGYDQIASRDMHIAVRSLMREAEGSKEGEFNYPYSNLYTSGPDSDDEYKMVFKMHLDDDTDDETVGNAWEIVKETDDEDKLKEIFRTAFAKVAKVPGASIKETREYFKKFDIF